MSPGSRPSGTPSMITRPSAATPRPTMTRSLPIGAGPASLRCDPGYPFIRVLDQVNARKEVADFIRRRLGGVGAVRGVALDRLRERLAQGARVGLRRVGRAHQRPPLLDG